MYIWLSGMFSFYLTRLWFLLGSIKTPDTIQAIWLHKICPLWKFNYLHWDTLSGSECFALPLSGRLNLPSPSGRPKTQGKRSISDISKICQAGLMSATFTSNRYARTTYKDVQQANIDGASVLAREDDKLLATSCKRQKHSVTPRFQRHTRFRNAIKIQVLRLSSKTW